MFSMISLATTMGYILMIYASSLDQWEKILALLGLLLIKGVDYTWGRQDESRLYETKIMPAFVSSVEKTFGMDTKIFIKDENNPNILTFNSEVGQELLNTLKKEQEKEK